VMGTRRRTQGGEEEEDSGKLLTAALLRGSSHINVLATNHSGRGRGPRAAVLNIVFPGSGHAPQVFRPQTHLETGGGEGLGRHIAAPNAGGGA